MSLQCLPSGLDWICITVWEEMLFEEFQDSCHGSHLECWNGTNLAVSESPCPPPCLRSSFSFTWLTVQEQMSFQDFQAGHHGGHFGYWNGTNLAILNLYVTQIPPRRTSRCVGCKRDNSHIIRVVISPVAEIVHTFALHNFDTLRHNLVIISGNEEEDQ